MKRVLHGSNASQEISAQAGTDFGISNKKTNAHIFDPWSNLFNICGYVITPNNPVFRHYAVSMPDTKAPFQRRSSMDPRVSLPRDGKIGTFVFKNRKIKL